MRKIIFMVCVLVILIWVGGCTNPAEESSYPDLYLESKENLPQQPEEPEYIPEPAETVSARFSVSNSTESLTVSDIAIICADAWPGGIQLPDILPPDSRAGINWLVDIHFPAISFAYETATSSGRAVFLHDAFVGEDFPRHPDISVSFRERDWLYARVSSNLWQGGEWQSIIYRYHPNIGQWLPASSGQRLFIAKVEPDLLHELYPDAEWDSPHPAVVLFTDEPIIDLNFLWFMSEDLDRQELTLDKFGDTLDIFLPGQYT